MPAIITPNQMISGFDFRFCVTTEIKSQGWKAPIIGLYQQHHRWKSQNVNVMTIKHMQKTHHS